MYASRWRDLGIQLEIPVHILDTISVDNRHVPAHSQTCCLDMLNRWMQRNADICWNELNTAIANLPPAHDKNFKREK